MVVELATVGLRKLNCLPDSYVVPGANLNLTFFLVRKMSKLLFFFRGALALYVHVMCVCVRA